MPPPHSASLEVPLVHVCLCQSSLTSYSSPAGADIGWGKVTQTYLKHLRCWNVEGHSVSSTVRGCPSMSDRLVSCRGRGAEAQTLVWLFFFRSTPQTRRHDSTVIHTLLWDVLHPTNQPSTLFPWHFGLFVLVFPSASERTPQTTIQHSISTACLIEIPHLHPSSNEGTRCIVLFPSSRPVQNPIEF